MTSTVVDRPQVPLKNMSAWIKSGVAVTATSASDVSRQAGLDWTVSLHDVTTTYQIPGQGQPVHIPVKNKQAVVKTTPTGEVIPLGIVGKKYKPFQNAEVFSVLDTLIDSGSGSVLIRPIIERLFCKNQINKIFRAKNQQHTYTLRHTSNARLDVNDVRTILDITYSSIQQYTDLATTLIEREATRSYAIDYFKKVFPLPSKIEDTPPHLLSQGEKKQRTNAMTARHGAMQIYSTSPTQENIRNTQFGLWQAVVEYADHGKPNKSKSLGIRTMSGASDNIKLRALELLTA